MQAEKRDLSLVIVSLAIIILVPLGACAYKQYIQSKRYFDSLQGEVNTLQAKLDEERAAAKERARELQAKLEEIKELTNTRLTEAKQLQEMILKLGHEDRENILQELREETREFLRPTFAQMTDLLEEIRKEIKKKQGQQDGAAPPPPQGKNK